MAKRFLILAVLVSSFAVTGGAQAACGRYVKIAHLNGAVSDTESIDVTIVADAGHVCDDGSVVLTNPVEEYPTKLIISGAASCEGDTMSGWDPFGFAAGLHDKAGPDGAAGTPDDEWSATACNIDITWSGFLSPFAPAVDRLDGAYIGKDTVTENGLVIVDGQEFTVNAPGRMWVGVTGEV